MRSHSSKSLRITSSFTPALFIHDLLCPWVPTLLAYAPRLVLEHVLLACEPWVAYFGFMVMSKYDSSRVFSIFSDEPSHPHFCQDKPTFD